MNSDQFKVDGDSSSPPLTEARYWDGRWQNGQTGWDLGRPHPLLEELVNRARESGLPANARFYIPGCGRAHDGIWLVQNGFSVVAADFAPLAVAAAEKNASELRASGILTGEAAARFSCRVEDAATCPEKDQGGYQAVFDRAMYCALRPELRAHYIEAVARRLRKDGFFLSLPFAEIAPSPEKPKGSGPPFEVTEAAMKEQLHPWFEPIHFELRHDGAVDQRILAEFLTVWKRR